MVASLGHKKKKKLYFEIFLKVSIQNKFVNHDFKATDLPDLPTEYAHPHIASI